MAENMPIAPNASGMNGTNAPPGVETVFRNWEVPPIFDPTGYITGLELLDGEATRVFTAGDDITFIMPTRLQGYTKNTETGQRFSVQEPQTSYRSFKVRCTSHMVIQLNPNEMAQWERALPGQRVSNILEAAERCRVEHMIDYVMPIILGAIPPENMGPTAGRHGHINLGTNTAPIQWTKDSSFAHLVEWQAMAEVSEMGWDPGNMFMYMDVHARAAIQMNREKFDRNSFASDAFGYLLPDSLNGFNLIFDKQENLFVGIDAGTKNPISNVIFGNPKATAFYCSPLDMTFWENRPPYGDALTTNDYMRSIIAYQAEVIRPEWLYLAVITTPSITV